MKDYIKKIIVKFKEQTPTNQAFIILIIFLLIGIIIRWKTIFEGVKRGFEFYNG